MKLVPLFLSFAVSMILSACGGSSASSQSEVAMSAAALLGQEIFKDSSLSGSGNMSCATCHKPDLGHASPFDTPVALGGVHLDQAGTRVPPSLRYLRFNAAFQIGTDGTPSGGFFWDGRADTLAAQAKGPFLNAKEMANVDVADVMRKIAAAPYADKFKQVFGAEIFSDVNLAFDRVAFALERYQKEDPDFAPFSSKFDAVNAGRASFTDQELRGLAWFNRPDKGNCAACHPSTKPDNAPGALFTDFSYDNLGVPRNASIPANNVASVFDLGLCQSGRSGLAANAEFCGAFKVPSLRNVALRKHFFHNGRFSDLSQVVQFYITRDIAPVGVWYPVFDLLGNPIYNDLPASPEWQKNVNTSEAPYNRRGLTPALSASEINDLLAFLQTLTDGFYIP